MAKNQNRKPLCEALKKHIDDGIIPTHIPGHKQGRAFDPLLALETKDGEWELDLKGIDGLDNLQQTNEAVKEAQELLADLFSAENSWFLINGIQDGFYAALSSVLVPQEAFLMDRSVCKEAWAAASLGRYDPILLPADRLPGSWLPTAVSPETIAKGLSLYPNTKAVLIRGSTQTGLLADIESISSVCAQAKAALLVDETEAPYFSFLVKGPRSALQAGADVSIQGLQQFDRGPAQGAFLHAAGEKIDQSKIASALQLMNSNNFSYLLMAALDMLREELWRCGTDQVKDRILSIEFAKEKWSKSFGDKCELLENLVPAHIKKDPLKLTLCYPGRIKRVTKTKVNEKIMKVRGSYVTFSLPVGKERLNPHDILEAIGCIEAETKSPFVRSELQRDFKKISATVNGDTFFRVSKEEAVGCKIAERTALIPPEGLIVYPGEVIEKDHIRIMEIEGHTHSLKVMDDPVRGDSNGKSH